MLLRLLAGSILGLGLLLPAGAVEQKPVDCCSAKLACCQASLPCCQGAAKAACCQKGQKCCSEGKACCTAAYKTSAHKPTGDKSAAKPAVSLVSLASMKTCCATKTSAKAGVQLADCCTAKLACCDAKSACCSSAAKPDCCKSGQKCCAGNKACCSVSQK